MFRLFITIIALLTMSMIALTQGMMVIGQRLPLQPQVIVWQRATHQQTTVDIRTGVQVHRNFLFNGLIEYSEDACDLVRIRTEPRLMLVEQTKGATHAVQTWDFVLTEPLEIHWTFRTWSPQQRWLTFKPDNGFLLVDLARERSYLLADGGASDIIWAFDDQHAAMIQDEQIQLMHIPTETVTQVIPLLSPLGQVRWSPDGKQLAVAGREQWADGSMGQMRLYVVDTESGDYQPIQRIDMSATLGAFSSDGEHITFLDTRSREITIVNAHTGVPWHIPIDIGGSFSPVWSPDGTQALIIADTGQIIVIDVEAQRTYTTKQDALRVYRWVDDTRFMYQAKDKSTHIAQWDAPTLKRVLHYPFSGTTGVCYPTK